MYVLAAVCWLVPGSSDVVQLDEGVAAGSGGSSHENLHTHGGKPNVSRPSDVISHGCDMSREPCIVGWSGNETRSILRALRHQSSLQAHGAIPSVGWLPHCRDSTAGDGDTAL